MFSDHLDLDLALKRRNDVLQHNRNVANIDMTTRASDWLWAVFCIMAVSALGMIVWAHMRPVGQRAFHFLSAVILTTASIAYFCMASNLGGTPIVVEFLRGGSLGENWIDAGIPANEITRSIWYVRYIDWTITTPLLLLTLLLTTGLPLSEVFATVFFDLVMIITGLVGSLVVSQYKWGLYSFGCAALIYIWYILLGPGRASASNLGPEYGSVYKKSTIFLSVVWLVYPIIWGCAEGGNLITVTSEMIAYGILDIIAKPVFTYYHIYSIGKVDTARYALTSGKLSDGSVAPSKASIAESGNLDATSRNRRVD